MVTEQWVVVNRTGCKAGEQPKPGWHPSGALAPPEPWGGVRCGNGPLGLPRVGIQQPSVTLFQEQEMWLQMMPELTLNTPFQKGIK